jgi:hypothetical protein
MGEVVAVEEKEYSTNQTVVASYLVYEGFELTDMDWEFGVCTFFFVDTQELRKEVLKFVNGDALVEPQSFNNAFTQVRKRMFDAKDDQ